MESRDQQIYGRLLRLPLFQGMSREELTELIGHTRLSFVRHEAGTVIYDEGQPCEAMTFLLGGRATLISHSDSHSYRVEEELPAPALLPPENLFGLSQCQAHTCQATTACDLLMLSKADVLRLTEHYGIFRSNLLNIIATRAQRLARRPWHDHPQSVRHKIGRFLSERCLYPTGAKCFHIKMQQLATAIGESRLQVSRELHAMERDGLIAHARGCIRVWAMERIEVF